MWLKNIGEAKQPSGHCLHLDVPLESKVHHGFRILNKESLFEWVLSRGSGTETSPVTFHSVCGAGSASSHYARNWGWDSETGHWPSSCSSSLAEVRCESRHLEPGSPPNHPLHDLPELTCAVNVLLFSTGSCAILSRVSVPKTKGGDTVNVNICHSRSRPCSLRVNQAAQKYPQDTFSTCAYTAKKNVLGI